jgi:holo-[acyl-carrier protein] synthase
VLLRTGVDLVEISRVQDAISRHGQRFLGRIYTDTELDRSHRHAGSLAGRFAAKEAVAKALGTGIGEIGWKDIEILGDEQNAPSVRLYGAAVLKSKDLGLTNWSVSISHSVSHAVAFVVALGEEH